MNVRLIVPTLDGFPTMPVERYGKAIADMGGGFTAVQGTGGWIAPDGSLVVEPVTVFDVSLADDASYSSDHGVGAIRQLASNIARDLRQDCVYLAIDGIAEFIR